MSETTDVVLGRILERVASIDAGVGRLVWRADEQERRVEGLENRVTIIETEKKHSLADKLASKVVWGALGFLGAMMFATISGAV